MNISIVIIGLMTFATVSHAAPCEKKLARTKLSSARIAAETPHTFRTDKPNDAIFAYFEKYRPRADVLSVATAPQEFGWSVRVKIDKGEAGPKLELFNVIKNDDGTCTVQSAGAQG